MTDRRTTSTALLAAAFAAALLHGCSAEALRPRFPQVEQATEAVHGGGERYRDHQQCMKASRTVDELVRCMDEAQWHFVAHGGVYPEPECWEAREKGELDRLAAHCFLRAPEHP
jgi:hypothetical protein